MSVDSKPSYKERCCNEAEALKSIMGEKILKISTESCWHTFTHLEVVAFLEPTDVKDVHVSLKVDIICPATYPDEIPKVVFTDVRNLDKKDLEELTTLLTKESTQRLGSEMIFDLLCAVEDFLKTRNNPAFSMHDVMKEKPFDVSDSKPIEASPNKESKEKVKELRKEDEIASLLNQKKKDLQFTDDIVEVELLGKLHDPSKFVRLQKLTKKVHRSQPSSLCTEYFGWDQSRVVFVSEYQFYYEFKSSNRGLGNRLNQFDEKLSNLIRDFKIHHVIDSGDELIAPYAFVHDTSTSKQNVIYNRKILVGQYLDVKAKQVTEGVVQRYFSKNDDALSICANQLLCALKRLHDDKLAHGMLSQESIWMMLESKKFILTDQWLFTYLLKFCDDFQRLTSNSRLNETIKPSLQSMKQKDVEKMADILTSLSNVNIKTRTDLFFSFIESCNKKTPLSELQNHEFLYSGFQTSSGSDVSATGDSQVSTMGLCGRLAKEYNVLGFLGEGGFGRVFQARNKLDSNDYAIKRISLNGYSKNDVEKIKNECAVFSKLTNEHIVRYFSSWVDHWDHPVNSTSNTTPSESLGIKKEVESSSDSEDSSGNVGFFKRHSVVESNYINRSQFTDFSIEFDNTGDNDESKENIIHNISQSPVGFLNSYLCLQMEYCQNGTLRHLIDKGRLCENVAMIWRLFNEIVSGINCLHEFNIIHRDIKPGNVFLDSNWSVKIGDFGLATRMVGGATTTSLKKPEWSNMTDGSMTKDVGTAYYIPPEAKNSSAQRNYDTKFDMYSVGVVLFEMIQEPPQTKSEKMSIMENLNENFKPTESFLRYLPKSHQESAEKLVKWCLKKNPTERPRSSELLASGFIPHITSKEDDFQKMLGQVIHNPRHQLHKTVIKELFTLQPMNANSKDFDKAFALNVGEKQDSVSRRRIIKDIMEEVLIEHGFAPVDVQTVIPNVVEEANSKEHIPVMNDSYNVVDRTGNVLSLINSPRQGLIRQLPHLTMQRGKFFVSDKSNKVSKGIYDYLHPDVQYECCVDSFGTKATKKYLLAEQVSVMNKLMSQLCIPSLQWTIYVGHIGFMEGISQFFGFTRKQYKILLEMASHFCNQKQDRVSFLFELAQRFDISDNRASEILKFLEFQCESVYELKDLFSNILKSRYEESIKKVQESLFEINEFTNAIGLIDSIVKVIFYPCYVYDCNVFVDGIVYTAKVSKSWGVVMAGGEYTRYFESISNCRNEDQSLMGFDCHVENFVKLAKKLNFFNPVNSVMVSATSPEFYPAAIEFADRLRECNIPVEVDYEFCDDFYCSQRSVDCVANFVSKSVVVINSREPGQGNYVEFKRSHKLTAAEASQFIFNRFKQPSTRPKQNSESFSHEPSAFTLSSANPSHICYTFGEFNQTKLSAAQRKKYQSHAQNILLPTCSKLSSKAKIEVLLTDIPVEVLNRIQSGIISSTLSNIINSFESLIKSHSRFKNELEELSEIIQRIATSGQLSYTVVFLLSPRLAENYFRVLL